MSKSIHFDIVFLNSVIDHIEDPVFVKDINHKWVLVNNSFGDLIGQNREELIGKTDYDFLDSSEADIYWEKDNEVFSTGELNVNHEFITSQEGVCRYIRTKKSLFETPSGNKYLVGVISDLTVEKQAKDALIESEKIAQDANNAKSRFLANVSHEIRTPLYSILSFTDLLLDEEECDEKLELLYAIRNCGKPLNSIVNEVLDISKIEAGKISLSDDEFSLKLLLQEVERIFVPLLQERRNILRIEIDNKVCESYRGDNFKLQQVLNNLLSNSNKFTRRGTILLKLDVLKEEKDRQTLVFCVTDTGIGIEKEFLPQLFDHFSQQDNSYTKEYPGTGLGLSIVKSYLNLMESEVKVASEVGKGTSMCFEVELGVNKVSKKELEEECKLDFSELGERKILIAEDNELNQMLLIKRLAFNNIKLTVVDNGLKAYEEAQKQQFDTILMDIQMPVMDGFESCEKIRTLPAYKEVPIIALTANVLSNEVNRIKDAGMHYMSKPVKLKELLSILVENNVRL